MLLHRYIKFVYAQSKFYFFKLPKTCFIFVLYNLLLTSTSDIIYDFTLRFQHLSLISLITPSMACSISYGSIYDLYLSMACKFFSQVLSTMFNKSKFKGFINSAWVWYTFFSGWKILFWTNICCLNKEALEEIYVE